MNKTDALKVGLTGLIVATLLPTAIFAKDSNLPPKGKSPLEWTAEEKRAYREKALAEIEAITPLTASKRVFAVIQTHSLARRACKRNSRSFFLCFAASKHAHLQK